MSALAFCDVDIFDASCFRRALRSDTVSRLRCGFPSSTGTAIGGVVALFASADAFSSSASCRCRPPSLGLADCGALPPRCLCPASGDTGFRFCGLPVLTLFASFWATRFGSSFCFASSASKSPKLSLKKSSMSASSSLMSTTSDGCCGGIAAISPNSPDGPFGALGLPTSSPAATSFARDRACVMASLLTRRAFRRPLPAAEPANPSLGMGYTSPNARALSSPRMSAAVRGGLVVSVVSAIAASSAVISQ